MYKKYIWKIWGNGLKPIYIAADSFDEALALARTINQNYNSGQIHSHKYSKI